MTAITYFNKFPSYCRMVAHAKSLANRSVLIDHCGLENIDLTSGFNNIEHVYSIEKETKRGFSKLSLIEFYSNEDAENLVKQAHHNEGLLPVPLKILRYNGRVGGGRVQRKLPFSMENVRLSCDKELSPSFSSYTELISNNTMSLAALKLRFVTLVNFERILCSGMFDEYELMPFGSSVIDMGCESGDLDLIITRKIDHHKQIRDATNNSQRYPRHEQPTSKLVHLDKSLYSETKDNSGFRGTMRWFDHVLREYMPLTDGFGVLTLHRAKVPIIKFTSRITNVDCDLSFDLGLDHRDNDLMTSVNPGILMTEILYSLCRRNNLIAAFVIYMRIFAKLNSITSKQPGVGMTNFQFLSLLIFFLQRVGINMEATRVSSSTSRHPDETDQGDEIPRHGHYSVTIVKSSDQQALVPPFKELINGSFLDDASQPLRFDDDELNQILPLVIVKFFRFYSNFDFSTNSLNLFESKQDRKLDNSSIYVTNPIEPSRNICHNVNRKALETFIKQVRYASTHVRADRSGNSNMTNCPLSLIKNLMIKHQKQAKKNRTFINNLEELDDSQPFNPDGVAQDVCRLSCKQQHQWVFPRMITC